MLGHEQRCNVIRWEEHRPGQLLPHPVEPLEHVLRRRLPERQYHGIGVARQSAGRPSRLVHGVHTNPEPSERAHDGELSMGVLVFDHSERHRRHRRINRELPPAAPRCPPPSLTQLDAPHAPIFPRALR
jgi:hypothetical protein